MLSIVVATENRIKRMDSMEDAPLTLSTFSDQPVYNVKAVCKRTGLTPATLRAWERRYGLPLPNRTDQGYRSYSDRDVAILFWLQQQIEMGISIGQAAQQLQGLLHSGQELLVKLPVMSEPLMTVQPRSPGILARELSDALGRLDEREADMLFAEASAIYTVETSLIHVLRKAVKHIREQRRQQQLLVTAEHFAQSYARQRVLNMIQAASTARTRPSVVTVGFADERNELDLLILGLLLRRLGWPVTHLGVDLDPIMLHPALANLNAGVILFHVDTHKNASLFRRSTGNRTRTS
jgi:MerR family transcriptional regulator, light-induced transcriptional regulator